jgi:cytochrome bd-type quinol oxidase subunit 2
MAGLRWKIQNALDESRMLVLGLQVLLGFHFRAVFEPKFAELPAQMQYLILTGLALIVLTLGLLFQPPLFHQLVERGNDTKRLNRLIARAMRPVLPIFLVALCLDVFITTSLAAGTALARAMMLAVGLVGVGYFVWLEWAAYHRAPTGQEHAMNNEVEEPTPLKNKIRQVLTEARVVLPGAQALMGFQFASVFMEGFDKIPYASKLTHLASLLSITLAIMFLVAPAAYHRIVDHGEETEDFYRFASKMVLAGIVALGLGIVGDLYLVGRQVTGSVPIAVALTVVSFLVLFGLWFGVTLWEAMRQRPSTPGLPRG